MNVKLECEVPNNAIYKFEGTINFDYQEVPLDADNIILRGSTLRNTEFIIGLVIFTGH